MKRFLSTSYTETSFNVAALFLRLAFGLLACINHGLPKLQGFSKLQHTFFDPFHIGHRWSLVLVIFAEVFCGILLVLGLFTRVAALIMAFSMAVALLLFHKGQPLANMELALVYFTALFAILLVGPGRISVDGMMGR